MCGWCWHTWCPGGETGGSNVGRIAQRTRWRSSKRKSESGPIGIAVHSIVGITWPLLALSMLACASNPGSWRSVDGDKRGCIVAILAEDDLAVAHVVMPDAQAGDVLFSQRCVERMSDELTLDITRLAHP